MNKQTQEVLKQGTLLNQSSGTTKFQVKTKKAMFIDWDKPA